jgi:hypothetical protein
MKSLKIIIPAIPPSRHEFNSKNWQMNWARKKAQKEKWYWLIREYLQDNCLRKIKSDEQESFNLLMALHHHPYFKNKVEISLNIFYNPKKHKLRDAQNIIAGTCQIFDILGMPRHKKITARSKPEGCKLGLIVDDDSKHLVWGKIEQKIGTPERTEIILTELN